MNCIIVDDITTSRTLISHYCDVNNISVKNEFSNGLDAIMWLKENEVDLIFLDLHMPTVSGKDFVKSIKNPPPVVIITSDPHFAIEAFNYHFIMGYLVKPIDLNSFNKVIERLNMTLKVSDTQGDVKKDELFINIDKRLIKIDINTIYLVKATDDSILIKTENGDFKVNSTLKTIMEKLPEDVFFQVHRSYIINLKKIIDIEMNSILINKDVIPIGRSKKPILMNLLNLL